MARKTVSACFLLLVFSLAFYAQTATVARSSSPPSLQTGITVEKYIVDYAVNADGTCVQTVETDRRLNSRSFLEKLKKYELQFNAGLQEVEVLEAAVIKVNGKKLALPRSSIQLRPTAQAEAAP